MLRIYSLLIPDYYKYHLEDGPENNYMDPLQVGIEIVFIT